MVVVHAVPLSSRDGFRRSRNGATGDRAGESQRAIHETFSAIDAPGESGSAQIAIGHLVELAADTSQHQAHAALALLEVLRRPEHGISSPWLQHCRSRVD